jgi:Uncharacterized alpha/beta hydrolase domain (DUF2235)
MCFGGGGVVVVKLILNNFFFLETLMSKNIALFIDGTWNKEDKKGATNVYKLYQAVNARSVKVPVAKENDGPNAPTGKVQIAHYIAGVGTGGPLDKLAGGLTGFGTEKRIKDAYLFLAKNYIEGDSVYLFGFSRGAFAVRSLASFIGVIGPQLSEKEIDIAEAYKRFLGATNTDEYLRSVESLDVETIETIPVHFIGVWDTVKALGLESFGIDWRSHPDFPQPPAHIHHARHALALHETRPEFEPKVWDRSSELNSKQSLEQVWFSGAHADVGGGYPQNESELSNIALDWMAKEAKAKDLVIDFSKLPSTVEVTDINPHFETKFLRNKPRQILENLAKEVDKQKTKSHMLHPTAKAHVRANKPMAFRFAGGKGAPWYGLFYEDASCYTTLMGIVFKHINYFFLKNGISAAKSAKKDKVRKQ